MEQWQKSHFTSIALMASMPTQNISPINRFTAASADRLHNSNTQASKSKRKSPVHLSCSRLIVNKEKCVNLTTPRTCQSDGHKISRAATKKWSPVPSIVFSMKDDKLAQNVVTSTSEITSARMADRPHFTESTLDRLTRPTLCRKAAIAETQAEAARSPSRIHPGDGHQMPKKPNSM
jgi:hypothetical protein